MPATTAGMPVPNNRRSPLPDAVPSDMRATMCAAARRCPHHTVPTVGPSVHIPGIRAWVRNQNFYRSVGLRAFVCSATESYDWLDCAGQLP